jgi:hypothetical protein
MGTVNSDTAFWLLRRRRMPELAKRAMSASA